LMIVWNYSGRSIDLGDTGPAAIWRRDGGDQFTHPVDLTPPPARDGLTIGLLPSGGLPGRVEITNVTSYGSPPVRSGVRPADDAVPEPTIPTSEPWVKKRPETLLRVYTVHDPSAQRADKRDWAIDTVLGENGREYYTVTALTSDAYGCELGPGANIIVLCQDAFEDERSYFVGRVAPSVDSVELHTKNGRSSPIHVENGWIASLADSSRSSNELVAKDVNGKIVGTYTFVLPTAVLPPQSRQP
jgi:hypothetical protein